MAPPQPRPPRLKPLRVRLTHGGEVDFHGDAVALRKVHPGAEIVSFADGSPYVKADQDTAPATSDEDGDADAKTDAKAATGKSGGTKVQAKAPASSGKQGS